MLIALCGGSCSGKKTVAEFLIGHHDFRPLTLRQDRRSGYQKSSLDPAAHQLDFADIEELLSFVTPRWKENWLLPEIWNREIFEALQWRPFFLLVSIDAPVIVRWRRLLTKEGFRPSQVSLENFTQGDDAELYRPKKGIAHLMANAKLRLLNNTNSLSDLQASLTALDLTNEQRLRPSWDQYFMELASLAARRSNCMKRKVGCVLVREKRVISTGYSGTPRNVRNCNDGGCPRCNAGIGAGVSLATCLCLHAEENALLEAGRERIREASVLYCDTCPCLTCSVKIVQVGISEVVYNRGYSMDDQAAAVFKEAGVKLRQFSPPQSGLVEFAQSDNELFLAE